MIGAAAHASGTRRAAALLLAEQLALAGGYVVAAWARLRWDRPGAALARAAAELAPAAALTLLAFQAGLYATDLLDLRIACRDRQGTRLLRALAAAVAVAAVGVLAAPPPLRDAALAGVAGAAVTLAIARARVEALAGRLGLRPRLFLVGDGRLARALAREIQGDGAAEIVGFGGPRTRGLPALARAAGARLVVVALDDRRGAPLDELLACRAAGLEVVGAAAFAEAALRKVPLELVRPGDLVYGGGFHRGRWRRVAHDLLGRLGAAALLLLTAPLWALAALLIAADGPGPILFRQARVGAGGGVFDVLKLRTMRLDAERAGAVWARRDDPRVTRVGRLLRATRLDELPQLLNVLRGEMALVGPRPERPEFVADLERQLPFFALRALVRPGITGWAQVRRPYAADLAEWREKLEHDLYYVKHRSLGLDLSILARTVKVVLTGRGAR